MFGALGAFLGSLFSSGKTVDLAVDAMRKVGGLDEASAQEKFKFIIDYNEATKHQSLMRRFIAILFTSLFAINSLVWLIATIAGYTTGAEGAQELAQAVYEYSENVIMPTTGLIVGFYFFGDLVSKARK